MIKSENEDSSAAEAEGENLEDSFKPDWHDEEGGAFTRGANSEG